MPGKFRVEADIRGEAIPVDIPGIGTAFVLRRVANHPSSPANGGWILFCQPTILPPEQIVSAIATFPSCDVPRVKPMVVVNRGTAANPDLEVLSYRDSGGNLALLRLSVTPTASPITIGLTEKYPWILTLPSPGPLKFGTYVDTAAVVTENALIYQMDFTRSADK